MTECRASMNNPKVSIIIPVYNGANYVREAIDSALAQTYKNIEIIVVNDGSTDGGATEKIARSYGDKIRYYGKSNGGVSTALNFGIKKMTGDYFSWLSHDDKYYPNKVEEDIKFLNNSDDKKIISFTNFDIINEKSEVTTDHVWDNLFDPVQWEYALLRGYLNGNAMLIPKEAFDKYGLFREDMRAIQDYELFFRFMKHYRYAHNPKITSALRIHSQQVTQTSKRVLEEGDPYWVEMAVSLPDKTKIKLEGSISNFYREMSIFLMETPYKKAAANLRKMIKKSKEKDKTYGVYEKTSLGNEFGIYLKQRATSNSVIRKIGKTLLRNRAMKRLYDYK